MSRSSLINPNYIASLDDNDPFSKEIKDIYDRKIKEIDEYVSRNAQTVELIQKDVDSKIKSLTHQHFMQWIKKKNIFPSTGEHINRGSELYIAMFNECVKRGFIDKRTKLCQNMKVKTKTCKWLKVTFADTLEISKKLNKIKKSHIDCECGNRALLYYVHDNDNKGDIGICKYCNESIKYRYLCKSCNCEYNYN